MSTARRADDGALVLGPTGEAGGGPALRPRQLGSQLAASLAGLARRSWPTLVLIGITLVVFWQDILGGQTYYGSDTVSFYYPLTRWYAERLRAGELPLWFPYIFGGYPLFADGEIGMLYPPHLIAYALLPVDQAFSLLRPLHFFLAGAFTIWLGRLIGLSLFGALVAGLTFSYGSFLVGHLQHENIVRSTVWLPLALGLFELALRRSGRARLLRLLACGLVVSFQMLGIHVQPVLISLLLLGAYAVCAPLAGPTGSPHPPLPAWRSLVRSVRLPSYALSRRLLARLAARLAALTVVVTVAAGVAAVQLLPLFELAQRSDRSAGVSYEFSTSYSVPPTQLVQLFLPYLFRPDNANYWGLWSAAETTIYIGVAPLLLALIAIAYLRTRPVAFFSLVLGCSLLLSLGDYLPLKLYSLVWSLPGFSYLRVPARFGMVFTLSAAVLAGAAADWLSSRGFDRRRAGFHRPRVRRLLSLAAAIGLSAIAFGALFLITREWLNLDPSGTRKAIETYYLSIRRGDWGLSASGVYYGLLRSFDLANPRTLGGLFLMAAVALVLVLRGRHLLSAGLWRGVLLLFVIVDLVSFAEGFYPRRPTAALNLSLPAVKFLSAQSGLQRVFVEPQLYGLLGPNQLVSAGVDFAGGYSSLEPRRASEFWWSIVRQDNILLDLFNVRYVVSPNWTPGRQAFDGVLFHPGDRLMRGVPGNPAGTEFFEIEPWWTESVTVIASGEGFRHLAYGEPVAEITVSGPDGQERLTLRAGIDVDDSAEPLLGPSCPCGRSGPTPAWTGASFQHPGQLSMLSGSTIPLSRPLLVTGVSFERIGPGNVLDLHGLGLHDRPGLPVRSVFSTDRLKYRRVYQDQDVSIFENRAAMPRAFVVGSALTEPASGSVIDHLLTGPIDPRETVLLEGPAEAVEVPSGTDQERSAVISSYGSQRVVVDVEAPLGGYLVLTDRYDEGWQAKVDGADAVLRRGDGMFRAVLLPPGARQVVFTYEAALFRLGAQISAVTLGLTGAIALGCLLVGRRSRC